MHKVDGVYISHIRLDELIDMEWVQLVIFETRTSPKNEYVANTGWA